MTYNISNSMRKNLVFGLVVIAGVFLTSGCGSDSVSSTTGTISIGVATQTSGLATSQLVIGKGFPVANAISAVDITKAEIVLTRIRFKSVGDDTLDFRSDDPILVNLDLTGTVQNLGSISVPAGTYDEARYRLKSLDSCGTLDSCTSAHILTYDSNPNMRELSIRFEGYVDGNTDSSFVWTSSLNKDQVVDLVSFVVVAGQTTNLTFLFDVNSWLSDGAGGKLDPRDTQNLSQIENNIKNDFEARTDSNI